MGVFVAAHGHPSAAISGLCQVQAQSASSHLRQSASSYLRVRPCTLSYARRWLNPHYAPSRLNTFSIRCSLVNTDFCHSIDSDECHEGTTSLESNCLIPVVHLESETLETEAFHLLVGDSSADTLLTTLPVLSEEEQNAIAATPAHPAGLYVLYACCLVGNSVEQLWNFAWPAAIASIHPSLRPVAVMGFFAKLAVIVGGPSIGKLMDRCPRLPAYNYLTVVQAAAQLLSVAMVIRAHVVHSTTASSMLAKPWFFVLVIALAVERLCGLALGVAMERDWVVLLAGVNRPTALAQANAILSRIDLICEVTGASLFGIFLSKFDPVTCLLLTASLMTWSLPVVVILGWLTNKLSAGVLDGAKSLQSDYGCLSPVFILDPKNMFAASVESIRHGWIEYIQQPVLPASLAYVLLYFNVLAPGGLMTAFLTQHGLRPPIIGAFSGLSAFIGVAATFVSAKMVERLGVLKAGAAGLIFQASLLTMAVAVYWTGYFSQKIPFLFFLSLIVLSRLGHMSYDIVGAQILQTGIPASKANLVGATEASVASLAESAMLGIVIVVNDVSHFGFLALLSLLSVVGAACLYCKWLKDRTDRQWSLFPLEPIFF